MKRRLCVAVRLGFACWFVQPACGEAGSAEPGTTGGSSASSSTQPTSASADDAGSSSVDTGVADTSGSGSETGDEPPRWQGLGPHAVGHASTSIALVDDRDATVQWWYPAAESGTAATLADLEDAERQADLAALLAAAPAPCTRAMLGSSPEVAPADDGPWPVVVFSHCSDCVRYSSTTIAESLASWGFVVAAVDHEGNTLFDSLAGTSVGVDGAFLEVRGDDIGRVIDAIEGASDVVPPLLAGQLDPARLGVMGHSFGSVTAGWVAERDDRVLAAVGIAAPMENPLLPGVTVGAIDVPLLLLLAQEDNSILEIGNNLIRSNFDDVAGPAWLVEFIDAGHWSFSDICALVEGFAPGCGDDERQTAPGEPFTYVDIDQTRRRAADWITTFFAAHLRDEADAAAWLAAPPPDAAIVVQSK